MTWICGTILFANPDPSNDKLAEFIEAPLHDHPANLALSEGSRRRWSRDVRTATRG